MVRTLNHLPTGVAQRGHKVASRRAWTSPAMDNQPRKGKSRTALALPC